MNELTLSGCRVQPLASYLKALGLFRLVAKQKDASALLSWKDDEAVLTTQLSRDELIGWFLEEYQPTPITSPWNGGSGYFPNDKSAKKALDSIERAPGQRFDSYRKTLADCRAALQRQGLTDKPETKVAKPRLMRYLRSTLTVADALEWLDAACVLSDEGWQMVPLLGKGGNDGRFEFSSNFAQNLVDLLLCSAKERLKVRELLNQAIFDTRCRGLGDVTIGQFAPGSAGGANTTSGFKGKPHVNPWDFVLAIEGAIVFSAAATRRLGDDTQGFSLPFTVSPSMGGHSSISTDGDKAQHEMWLPTWSSSISLGELRIVFAEGRAQVGKRQAANGVDFARAVASLGVERGLEAFERYTFMVRNGDNCFATPTGRYRVRSGSSRRAVDLLRDLDLWLRRYRRKAESHGGAAIRSLFRQFDDAVLELCRGVGRSNQMRILRILGAIQRQLGKMPKLHKRSDPELYVPPISGLTPDWWPAADESSELRLAMGLRGLWQIRDFVEPVERYDWRDESRDAVWTRDRLANNLIRVLKRRFLFQPTHGKEILTGSKLQQWRFGSSTAHLIGPHDLERFLYSKTDDALLESLFWGLLLLSVPDHEVVRSSQAGIHRLPADYCKLKVAYGAFDPRGPSQETGKDWLAPRTILERLASSQDDALEECDRFLIGKGKIPKLRGRRGCLDPPRLAASMLFPTSHSLFQGLVLQAFPVSEDETKENSHAH